MAIGRVNYASWIFRVLACDTFLPAAVVLIPTIIELLLPDQRTPIEITSVLLPMAAFWLRYRSGKHRIASNGCARSVRSVQFFVFCVGIIPLALLECFFILVSPVKLLSGRNDRTFFAALFLFYLGAMVIAMYPGKERLSRARIEELDAFPEADRSL